MKHVFSVVTGLLMLGGVAFAQTAEIDDLKAQLEQQKEELQKLKENIDASNKELEMVNDQIKDSDYKLSSINEKIEDLCGQLGEAANGGAKNPACEQ
ncbi:MAG: hypothetical protein KDJ38_17720 [Gammaproteobacteria bacterium]|nr:hypothetical protein [Gammaproteobacteria bacterium]